MRLSGREPIANFVEAIRSGEQAIDDTDERQGRDKSLGASLEYGFRHAFKDDELPIIALLHLFRGTVDVDALAWMGRRDNALPELKGKNKENLTGVIDRARETGLLTRLGGTFYSIHPALPWFIRRFFVQHYDGQAGRSTAASALRAWVEAMGAMGNYYHRQFHEGKSEVIAFLALEEGNLLHAFLTARRNNWRSHVIPVMHGIHVLYLHQGRRSEWFRLVVQITPDYCTPTYDPIPGQEDPYTTFMEYLVQLATDRDRDYARAAALQEKVIDWTRQQAGSTLALSPDAVLDPAQRNRIRSPAVSVESMGHILREQSNCDCVRHYSEAIRLFQRIDDTTAEAVVQLNLGHAYMNIAAIRNLDEAEAAYQRSLALRAPKSARKHYRRQGIRRRNCFEAAEPAAHPFIAGI